MDELDYKGAPSVHGEWLIFSYIYKVNKINRLIEKNSFIFNKNLKKRFLKKTY